MPEVLRPVWIVMRRELRDQFRDWRIIFPILFLTLFFPGLMNFFAERAVGFVQKYGANLVATRFIPFLLMIVGFFPISFSLVIALESFVGEMERRSIEPLLSSPLQDWQLYLGKLLAALISPLMASYAGMLVYLVAIYRTIQWTADPEFLFLIISLTAVQGLVMISGAVVISTQTTSVRAANLLASFIIIPVALLIQGESIILFWGGYAALWLVVLGLIILSGLLIRTGITHFNREELLGRELDEIHISKSWKIFKGAFLGNAHSVHDWYTQEVGSTMRKLIIPIILMGVMLIAGTWLGAEQAVQLHLPQDVLGLNELRNLEPGIALGMRQAGLFSFGGVITIWLHNLRAIALATLLGAFSFGVCGVIVLMAPLAVLGFFAGASASAGFTPAVFLTAFTFPHGLIEIPAMMIAGAAILRIGATLVTPANGKTIGEAWLTAIADWAKIMIAVAMPLFLLAAFIEVYITPLTAMKLLGIS